MLTLKSHSRVAHPCTHTRTPITVTHTASGRQFNYSSRCGDWKQTLATPPTGLHECQDYLHALCMSVCVCDGVCKCVCQSFGCHKARFWWLALSECDASTVDNGPHLGARTANYHSPSAHTLPANATGNCLRHAALHQQQQQQHLPIQSVSQFQLLFNRLRHRRLASKWDFSICLTCRCHLSAHETCIYLYMYVYM